ncbi:MAG TPA: magnesium/cobalt transporter CorA [Solirubrobacterales bacterium]|jgi:magnesium transporter|nr:magnesium/cobalt transporter CorA [Solirubrobacterales bacterium]
MIVDCAVYEHGKRRAGGLGLDQAGAACRGDGAFVWLGVVEPSAEEFEAIAREFDLHELAVEDAVKAHQRPKVELFGETLFVVVKTVTHPDIHPDTDHGIEVGELLLFVNTDFIITVRHGDGKLISVRERVERRPDLLAHGTGVVLYAILDHVVDGYGDVAQAIDGEIQAVEREVFSNERTNPAEQIYKLEREVLDLYRAVAPLLEAIDEIGEGRFEAIPDELHDYFRDVHDHLQRVTGRVASFRELLSSALQANLTQVSVRQNEDMRKISAWVAIAAVPTMVAGIYGMNFDHMPELHWRYGYFTVLVFIATICLALYRRFKRVGWL